MTARVFGLMNAVTDTMKEGAPAQALGAAVAGMFELSEEDKAFLRGPYVGRPAGCLAHERLMELARRTRRPTWFERVHIARCKLCTMAFSTPR